MSKIFITSDTHFNHKNIAGPSVSNWDKGYRDFDSVEEMNEAILDSINSKVDKDDILYHLGDFAMGKSDAIRGFRDKIVCKNIHLILGNHDDKVRRVPNYKDMFASVHNMYEMYYNKQLIVMCHYPLHVWNKHAKGSLHFFGHCHGSLGPQTRKRVDVGWCTWREPKPIDFFVDLLNDREVEVVDHHNTNTSY